MAYSVVINPAVWEYHLTRPEREHALTVAHVLVERGRRYPDLEQSFHCLSGAWTILAAEGQQRAAEGRWGEARQAFAGLEALCAETARVQWQRGELERARKAATALCAELKRYPPRWREAAAWRMREQLKQLIAEARGRQEPLREADAYRLLGAYDYGMVQAGQSSMDAALHAAQQSLQFTDRLSPGPEQLERKRRAAASLGVVEQYSGRPLEAIPGFQLALQLTPPDASDELRQQRVIWGSQLATFHMALGQLQQASRLIQEVVPEAGGLEGRRLMPKNGWDFYHAARAQLYRFLGNVTLAREQYHSAMDRKGSRDVLYALALAELEADELESRGLDPGRAPEVRRLLREATARINDGDPLIRQGGFQAKARRCALDGQLREAVGAWQHAAGCATQRGHEQDLAGIHLAQAHLLARQGEGDQVEEAASLFEEVGRYAARASLPHFQWQARFGLGIVAERRGQIERALRLYREAAEVAERLRERSALPDHAVARQLPESGAIYHRAALLMVRQGRDREAFDRARRYQGQVLRRLLSGGVDPGAGPGANAVALERQRETVERLRNELGRLASRQLDRRPGPRRAALEPALREARRRYHAAAAELARLENPSITGPETSDLVPVERLNRLAAEEHLTPVAYLTTEEELLIFVLTGSDVRVLRRAVSRRQLARLVTKFETECWSDPGGRPFSPEAVAAARALYGHLIRPVEAYLRRRRLLVVVPDGPLHRLAFDGLVVPGVNRRYLVQDRPVAVEPYLDALYYAFKAQTVPGQAAVLARSYRERPSRWYRIALERGSVGELRAALREAREVARLLPARLFTEAEADRDRFWQALRGPAAWFTMHAVLNRDNPAATALLLAGKQGTDQLSVAELVEDAPPNSLRHLRLLALPVCRSADGAPGTGEGRIGLAWAFHRLGAQSVLACGWELHDEAGRQLMTRFAANLGTGMGRAEALQQAQLALLRDPRYRHPYYWAAPVLSGRTDPLGPLQPPPPVVPSAGIAAVAALVVILALAALYLRARRTARPSPRR